MKKTGFERLYLPSLRAVILGLAVALCCASVGCKSRNAAEEEAEVSEEGGEEQAADEKKASPKESEHASDTASAKEGQEKSGKPGPGNKAGGKESAPKDQPVDKSAEHESPQPPMSPDQALARLKAGNEAFLRGSLSIAHLTAERRSSLAAGQHPFAIILSCSDSRVPPEQVFSQGLGDLFTVRVAGNIADPATIASIEYAAAHLAVPLLVVMGHTECGAVKAALAGAHDTPSITELVKAIEPALADLSKQAPASDTEPAVRANVRQVRGELLRQSPLLSELVQKKRLKLVQAIYDVKTGEAKFIK